jgi:capsular exopolysaccharide synthesis family protein
MVTSPLSSFPEGVRRIKANLDQAHHRGILAARGSRPAGGRVIMVTSSTANEGKSTISLSLARAYALARHRAVIVDCDLRKPTLHRMLGMRPSGSLMQYLDADANTIPAGLVMTDPVSSLHAVVGSEPSEIPTDQLVTGPAFAQLLEDLRASYDVVVLDTPPIGPVVDGLYLAQMADYLVFVLRAGTTSQTEARMALQSLRNAKAMDGEVFTVLNQQDRASAWYKGRYESYYFSDAN